MKLSAQVTMWLGAVLALFALGYAFTGFSSIDASATDAQREAAQGFALFWLFLGVVFVVISVISWLMAKGRLGALDED
jgi:NADH:ubiquinone oxidoreductase subunit 6 (subunit J)